MSKALFEKGEEVVITERSSSNGFKPTVTTGNVKEMCGTHNVAVRTTGGKDRIVNVKYVQRVEGKKVKTPSNFEPAVLVDTKEIGVMIRGARNSRNVTAEFMATLLRVDVGDLKKFESGQELPSDDVVLRLADVLSAPLDPLVASLEYSKQKELARKAEQEALERSALEHAAKQKADNEARERAEGERIKEDTIKRLERTDNEFSDFCERLSTLVPIPMAIPLGAARRKHWFVFARALYELK